VTLLFSQQQRLLADFKEWSGGFFPDECEKAQIEAYLASALPVEFNEVEARCYLMEF